jgi:DNA-binding NtrC family response regulator
MSATLVYLFEDDPAVRALLVEVLELEVGAQVHICADLAELQTRCRSEPPDAVVADFWGTSHKELSESERAEIEALAQLAPLVLVSARGWMQQAEPQELGVAGLIHKPLELDEFVTVVQDAIAGGESVQELPRRDALSVFLLPGF